jgi:zinc protease
VAVHGGRALLRVLCAGLVGVGPGLALHPAGAGEVVETTLDNGLRVLVEADHRSSTVALQIRYGVGSRNETEGRSGLSHFLEHMMFKGTARYGPRAYSRLIERLGGEENAYTGRDATTYHVTVAADRIDLVLDLEADRMRNLRLDPKELESERQVVMEERRTRAEDDPVGALAEEFARVAFVSHPYRIPTIGLMPDIERLTVADLRGWYDTYYWPNNTVLIAVGDVEPAAFLEKVRARFGPIPRGPAPPPVTAVEPEQHGERRVTVKKEAHLPVVYVGYPVPNYRSPDAYPLEVLSTLLSTGRASRLYQRLVYGGRLALDAGGDYSLLTADPDLFTFYVTVLPEKPVAEAERALALEIERFRAEPPGEEELQRAKNQIEASFLFGQDSLAARASMLGLYESNGGWRGRDAYLPRVRAVTGEDIQRVAHQYFVDAHKTTAILVPVPPAAAPTLTERPGQRRQR